MSHFTVLVIGDDVDGQLAPYDENIEAEPHREDEDVDVVEIRKYIEERREEYLQWVLAGKPELTADPKDNTAYWKERGIKDIESGTTVLPSPDASDLEVVKFYHGDEYSYDAEQDQWYRMSTYNPRSKWDWYQIGGRWNGFFTLKPDGNGKIGSGGLLTPTTTDPLAADQAKKGDIDFEAMKVKGMESRRKNWAEYQAEIKGEGRASEHIKKAIEDGDIEALEKHKNFARFIHGIKEEDTEESHVNGWAFSTFAVVKDGEWYERGRMGWWACVSDEMDDDEWQEQFMQLVGDLPDDTMLTLIDAHI